MSAIASHLRILGDTIWVYTCLAFFFVALYLLGAEAGCLLSETGMNLARMIALFIVLDFAFGSFAANGYFRRARSDPTRFSTSWLAGASPRTFCHTPSAYSLVGLCLSSNSTQVPRSSRR